MTEYNPDSPTEDFVQMEQTLLLARERLRSSWVNFVEGYDEAGPDVPVEIRRRFIDLLLEIDSYFPLSSQGEGDPLAKRKPSTRIPFRKIIEDQTLKSILKTVEDLCELLDQSTNRPPE